MASNIQAASVDLDTLLASRVTAARANVGYQTAGVDIANTYEKLSRDQQIPAIGISSVGTDITTLFMGNVAQYSSTVRDTVTRTTAWVTSCIHEEQITFSSVSSRNDFFLYGGRLIWSGSRTGGTVSTKNTDWGTLLTNTGTIELGKTGTYKNVNNTVNAIGSDSLTGSLQTIYSASGTGAYATNSIVIQAYQTSTTVIRIRVTLSDGASGTIDESVNGTLTGTLSERRHPSQTAPTYSTITSFTSGS